MKLYIRFFSILMLAISVSISGCLKDKDYDNGSIQSIHSTGATPKVVELKVAATNSTNFLAFSVDNSDNDTVVNLIPVNLATKDPAPVDLHVTLTQNNQLVTDYNAANTDTTVTDDNPDPSGKVTAYEVPTTFSVVDPVVVIPKGQHTGYLQIKFKPSDFLGHEYAIGYSITKIDEAGYTISGNMQNAVVAVGIKNIYDGEYSMTIKTSGWAAYGISDGQTKKWGAMSLATSGPSSVVFGDNNGVQIAFADDGSQASFGAATPQFNFDLTTNKLISIDNLTPDSRNRAFAPDPAHTSQFDPATKSMDLYYIMSQNGRPNQLIELHFTYTGPR